MWILDEKGEEGPRVIKKEITYVPGLYKIFDEILGKITVYYLFYTYNLGILF